MQTDFEALQAEPLPSETTLSTQVAQQQFEDRIWMDANLNQMDDILRLHYDKSLAEFTDTVILHTCKMLKALRGAFFVRQADYLQAVGGYACRPEHLLNSRFLLGDGLIGQAARSQESLYLEDMPAQNAVVASGLAQVSSSSVAIIPLLFNDHTHGVLELTTLHPLPELHKQLLERLGRNIASTLQSIQHHLNTKNLLQEAQQLAEQMRAQEEELRQNLEELHSSQEEMRRQQRHVEQKEAQLRAFLDSSSDSMLMIDKNYTITLGNRTFLQGFAAAGIQIELDRTNLRTIFNDKNWSEIQPYLQQVFGGEACTFRYIYELQTEAYGTVHMHNQTTLSPILEGDQVVGATLISHDFSELQQTLHDSQQKTEELMATEEELRQNLEELSTSQEQLERHHTDLQAAGNSMRALVNLSPDIMVLLDSDLTVRLANATVKGFFEGQGVEVREGYSHFPDLFPPQAWEPFALAMESALQGTPYTMEHSMEGDGKCFYFLSKFSPIFNEQQEVIAIACIGQLQRTE